MIIMKNILRKLLILFFVLNFFLFLLKIFEFNQIILILCVLVLAKIVIKFEAVLLKLL